MSSYACAGEIELRTEGNMGRLKTVSNETRVILDELNKEYKPPEPKKEAEKPKLDKFNAVSGTFLFLILLLFCL